MDNRHLYGFRWHASLNGVSQPKPISMPIASAYQPAVGGTNVDLHAGDPVKQLSDGTVDLCLAGESIFGIAIGFSPQFDGNVMKPASKYRGGTTWGTNNSRKGFAYIIPAVGNLFLCDADDKTTATTEAGYVALVGENVDHALPKDTTNADDPKADPKLDVSTHVTTTAQWRIMGILTYPEPDFSGLNVPLVVVVNETQQAPYVTTGT